MGKMPYTAKNLTIHQNTKEDVRRQFGPPPKLPGDDAFSLSRYPFEEI